MRGRSTVTPHSRRWPSARGRGRRSANRARRHRRTACHPRHVRRRGVPTASRLGRPCSRVPCARSDPRSGVRSYAGCSVRSSAGGVA